MSDGATVVLRPLVDADLPAVLELLATSLAGGPTGERTEEFFRWKHRANPAGASLGLVAEDPVSRALVGVRLFLRWELRLGEEVVRAVRAVDTATHPAHQGRGIFRRLTLAALEQVDAEGVHLVFNTPNDQSRPGYLTMGWSTVGEVPVRLRPVRPVRVVRGVLAGSGQQAVVGVPEPVASPLPRAADVLRERSREVAGLLAEQEAGADPHRLRTHRTPTYLDWRYGCAPGLDYRAVPVERGGRLVGLGLGRLRRRGPLAELTLGEVITAPGDRRAAASVLRRAARAGVDHVAAHLDPAGGLAAAGLRAGYLPVPGRGLTLVAHGRRPLPLDPTRLDSWALSLGDLEVF